MNAFCDWFSNFYYNAHVKNKKNNEIQGIKMDVVSSGAFLPFSFLVCLVHLFWVCTPKPKLSF